MKYEVVAKNGSILETVDNVVYFQHVDGYFYFNGKLKSDNSRDILYAVSDDSVRAIKKID